MVVVLQSLDMGNAVITAWPLLESSVFGSGRISNFFFSCLYLCSHTGNIKASPRCPFRDSCVEFTER